MNSPAKLVVVFQRVFDLVAEVHFAEQGVVGAFVDVGHGNFDALGIAIRIPESVDVEPCVQRRNDGYTDHDDPGGRYGDESLRSRRRICSTLRIVSPVQWMFDRVRA